MKLRCLMVALTLLVAFASDSWGQSQEPSPSAREAAQPEQHETAKPQQPANTNQNPASPPPIIVNVTAAPKTEAEKHDEASEREEKAKLDRRLVELTGDLAFFTAALFYATGGLVFATVVLAVLGFVQSRDIKRTVTVAEGANKLNRDNFVAAQRPWLRADVTLSSQLYTDGNTAAVELTIIIRNAGLTPAFDIIPHVLTHHDGPGSGAVDRYREVSEMFRQQPIGENTYGAVLFHGDSALVFKGGHAHATFHKEQIDIARAAAKPGDANFFAPGIIVCIDYVSVSRDTHYQTGFVYVLLRNDDVTPGVFRSFDPAEGDIPQDKLMLRLHPVGSFTI